MAMLFQLEQNLGDVGQESGQKVANRVLSISTNSGLQKLKQRIRATTLVYFGRPNVPHYVIRLTCDTHRGYFSLSADLDDSAKRARDIKLHLSLHGWEKTVAAYPPLGGKKISGLTVGEFLALVEKHGRIDPPTYFCYARKLRLLVSGVMGLKHSGKDKYSGTSVVSKWKAAVHEVPLASITPKKVELWRSDYLAARAQAAARACAHQKDAESILTARKRAEHTVNSILRNARSLFAPQTLKKVCNCEPLLQLPAPLPFDGVDLLEEREADYFYVSEVDADSLVEKAMQELKDEVLVIFVLAIGGGLRRSEIDQLPWSRVDLEQGIILVSQTATSDLKSDSSTGDVELEPQFAEVLRQHWKVSKGSFVLRPEVPGRYVPTYHYYRCDKDFDLLAEWLNAQGMKKAQKKIHTLRKEFGSVIAAEHGIHVACSSLRQSTIALTAKFYSKRKSVPTSFFAKSKPVAIEHKHSDADAIADALLAKMVAQGLVMKPKAT